MEVKRFFDVIVSAMALLALSPLLLVMSLVIAVMLGRPVFFVQPRPGLHGRLFNMIKFRTMTDQRDESGRLRRDEERLTSVGRLLRSISLTNCRSLWNVFKGEMSLVGPRPLLTQYLDRYTPRQRRRHRSQAGYYRLGAG